MYAFVSAFNQYSHQNSHYIAGARQKRPTVPPEVSNYIVESYVHMRKKMDEAQKDEEEGQKLKSYISPRSLLGVLRLSQALARLRYSDAVEHGDVDEALRLIDVSKESLLEDDERNQDHDRTDISKIFRLIKEEAKKLRKSDGGRRKKARRLGKGPNGERDYDMDDDDEYGEDEVSIVALRSRILGAGHTEAAFMETIIKASPRCLYRVRTKLTSVYSTKNLTSGFVSQTTRDSASTRNLLSLSIHIMCCTLIAFCSLTPSL